MTLPVPASEGHAQQPAGRLGTARDWTDYLSPITRQRGVIVDESSTD
jgi:hypothetical protein